jgi:hypothetical protein
MLLLSTNAVRAQQSMQHLAAAAQTPVGAMYSLPFQDTIYGGAGPNHDATANVLNIQPVIPITVGDWNIISRTIAPLIYLPSLTTGPSEITEQLQAFDYALSPTGGPRWAVRPHLVFLFSR